MKREEENNNSSGTASVVLGIIGIASVIFTFFAVFAPLAGLALSITALFFALSQKKIGQNKWSKYGMVLAIIGIILNVLILLGMISFINNFSNEYQALCEAAGGCENIPNYLQTQQLAGSY